MDEDSHSYYLIKQSETILNQLKEQARKISTAEQKISSNLRNIKSGQSEPRVFSQSNIQNIPVSYRPSFMPSQVKGSPMEHIQEYPQGLDGEDEYRNAEDIQFQIDSATQLKSTLDNEMSFANALQQAIVPTFQIVFVPFNKLYRSPVLQLKGKNKLILARKYKGTNFNISDGKISDGKIYRFTRVVNDEDQLLETLQKFRGTVGLIGSFGTLKKKIHMCLFIKHYQRLLHQISASENSQSSVRVEYVQIVNKSIVTHVHQLFSFDRHSCRAQSARVSSLFQNILTLMIDKHKGTQKIKHRTRMTRIVHEGGNHPADRFEVVSSSNESESVFQGYKLDGVVWCINPLVKHYQMTQNTLEFAQKMSVLAAQIK